MNLDSIDNHTLFEDLVRILNTKFSAVPDFGILAGQAVASALYEHLKIGTGPFNDIDTFVHEDQAPYCPIIDNEDEPEKVEFFKRELCRSEGMGKMAVAGTSHGLSLLEAIDCDGYLVTYSHNDLAAPHINYVRISPQNLTYGTTEALRKQGLPLVHGYGLSILKGFDINACQIALDMSKKEVVWTGAFQDFLFQRRLETTFWGTPMHTAVRLLKKQQELTFATLDIDEQMAQLQNARQIFIHLEHQRAHENGDHRRSHLPGNLFSPIYLKRALVHEKILSQYFDLEVKPCLFYNTPTNLDLNDEDYEKAKAASAICKDMYVLTPKQFCEQTVSKYLEAFPLTSRYQGVCEQINRFIPFWLPIMRNRKGCANMERLLTLNKQAFFSDDQHPDEDVLYNWWTLSHLLDGFKSMRSMSDNQLLSAIRIYRKHPNLIFEFVRHEHCAFESILRRAQQIHWLEKHRLGYYVGLIENGTFRDREGLEQTYHDQSSPIFRLQQAHYVSFEDKHFKQRFKLKSKEYLTAAHAINTPSRLEPILARLQQQHPQFQLRELSSFGELMLEGHEMKHCVGGYYGMVERGQSLIVALNSNPKNPFDFTSRSTLEISLYSTKDDDTRFEARRVQLQGRLNTQAPDEHDKVADALIALINAHILQWEQGTLLDSAFTQFNRLCVAHADVLQARSSRYVA